MKLADRIVIGGYAAGRKDSSAGRYQHNRGGEAHG
jgi:hypothetical protein